MVRRIIGFIELLLYIVTYIFAFPVWQSSSACTYDSDDYVSSMMMTMVVMGVAFTLSFITFRLIIRESTKNSKKAIIVLSVIEFISAFLSVLQIQGLDVLAKRNDSIEGIMYNSRALVLLTIIMIIVVVKTLIEVYGLIKFEKYVCTSNDESTSRELWSVKVVQGLNVLLAMSVFVIPFIADSIGVFKEAIIAICIPCAVWFVVVLNELVAQKKYIAVVLSLLVFIKMIRGMVYHIYAAVFSTNEMMEVVDTYISVVQVMIVIELLFLILDGVIRFRKDKNCLNLRKKMSIIISIVVIIGVIGGIVYQNTNRELLTGYYYNYDDNESYLELKEDGTFYFSVSVYVSWALEGTYKVDDNYLILYPTNDKEIKFEIDNKKLSIIDGGNYAETLLTEGMKYKWSKERK